MQNKTILKKYNVELDNSSYDIILGENILYSNILVQILEERTKNKNIVLTLDAFFKEEVCDNLIKMLSSCGYNIYVYSMSAGKHNKTISEAIKIYEFLETKQISRDSTMIALGGGVVGDLAGFVASTYHRGMNLINIPTTLTAMIDSSIGGKVAINFRKTINAIGNYYHPILNVVDFCFIDSLPERDFKAGLAEIIKCAIISDKELFNFLLEHTGKILSKNEEALRYVMCRAIEIKLEHVSGDVREGGKRLKLNYGHTLGHAIEISTDILTEVYKHGEGVALGMIGAAFLAKEHFGQDECILKAHENILDKYGLPLRVSAKKIGFNRESLIEECITNVYKDKKRRDNKLRFIFPEEIGRCKVYKSDIDINDLIVKTYNYLIKE